MESCCNADICETRQDVRVCNVVISRRKTTATFHEWTVVHKQVVVLDGQPDTVEDMNLVLKESETITHSNTIVAVCYESAVLSYL